MSPPTTRITVYGGTWPAQIWQRFMSDSLADVPAADFPEPLPPTTTTALPPAQRGPGPDVAVASVVGLPAADAVAALQAQGLIVRQSTVPDYTYPAGYVRAQAPAPGVVVSGGTKATIEISTGSPSSGTFVPSVIGRTQDQAVGDLRAAGLVANVVEQDPDPGEAGPVHPGSVWKQSPPPGSAVASGATVTIYVRPPRK
jgi:beta-lactam-binding protein with PASTA domain